MTYRNTALFGCLLCTLVCFHVADSMTTCPNNTFYNTNSSSGRIYRNNLEFLLSNLVSNASQPNGFYNFTAGSNGSSVYGLFLCRGDVTTSACQDCLTEARSGVLKDCPVVKTAAIWLDQCMLRYSDQSIISRVDGTAAWYMWNPNPVSENDRPLFNQVLGETLDHIADTASSDRSGRKFAVQEANFTSFQKIFALGQCTPDITSLECNGCLRGAISNLPQCCNNLTGGRVISLSCNIRYETYPFYNEVAAPPPQPIPTSPLPPSPSLPAPAISSKDNGVSTTTVVAIVVPSSIVAIVAFVIVFCFTRKAKKIEARQATEETTGMSSVSIDAESLRCSFNQVQAYTNYFADENKLGEGGFGPVYKGTLPNGQLVAVKRLSRSSAQGAQEFINEIALVAKLQHRNLVRLLGYCLEGVEKILIYELVHNKSLDYFLFDVEKQPLLDWLTRYKIIGGIAKGLLYLHEESHIKIIHRDLKASNVLLDQNMNPKIADFGLAKLCEIDQSEGNTSKIAGTYGYMAPEYALHGIFSIKSDVFSFGVLILEIISGKKNSTLHSNGANDLLTYAWKQWMEGTPLSLVDPSIQDSYVRNEVIRCIQIGLLCVQEEVERRPTMASIVLMLNSYSTSLSIPNPPAFFIESRTGRLPRELPVEDSNKSLSVRDFSGNEEPITDLYPR